MSLDPKAPAPIQVYTKEDVALSQLESAILLWFNYGDPISILQLAAASNDCFNALSAHAGHSSFYQEWFKSQSKTFQKRMLYIQNWIKHGLKKTTRPLRYSPIQAEALMVDSIQSHFNLTGMNTPLIRLFVLRLAFESPDWVLPMKREFFAESPEVEQIRHFDRPQFLEVFFQRLRQLSQA